MATVRIKFRASSIGTKEGTLFFQVIHNRVVRQTGTGCKLYPNEWDDGKSDVILPKADAESTAHNANAPNRREYLLSVRERLRAERARLMSVIRQMEQAREAFTADGIVERYLNDSDEGGFLAFSRSHIAHLGRTGRGRAAEKAQSALNSFIRFHGEEDLPFCDFNSDLMEEYGGWLKGKDLCMNTVSFYMRTLRTTYNQAVERGLTAQQNPFKYVYTGIGKTVKRAVPLSVVRKIRNLHLTLSPQKDLSRDLFMFSFYMRGMSFIDMAFLKKQDLQNGMLAYRRHKTGQRIAVKWEQPMQDIVDKYDTGGTPYLLPIIKGAEEDATRQYRNAAHVANRWLKEIGRDIGLAVPLTTYVARHSWASIARSKNVPLSVISEALGHDSEKTTRIYLASLDTSAVDRANSRIMKSL